MRALGEVPKGGPGQVPTRHVKLHLEQCVSRCRLKTRHAAHC